MANDIDRQRLVFDRGSWLRNVSAHELKDGTIAWGQFEIPEIPDFDDDIVYTLTGPERPDSVARRFYGNPSLWWVIAIKNGFRLPFSQLRGGQKIVIPSPAEILSRISTDSALRF
jgi:hypothetical protein